MKNYLAQVDGLLRNSFAWQQQLMSQMQTQFLHLLPHTKLSFEVALAEHCNLNCRGCDHFSPLATPELVDFDKLLMDFTRLANLFGKRVRRVDLLGGEPLLNPDIINFFKMSRKVFSEAFIHIISNGTLLLRVPEEFWTACRENSIVIFVTKYPIPVDYDAIQERAKYYQVDFRYFNAGEPVKKLYSMKLDLDGLQDDSKNFLICHRANGCIYLQNGRLWTCTVAPTARHFDRHFGTHIFDEESNSIDIHKATSAEEIMQFLAKPIPFCAYCNITATTYGMDWTQSKKEITEWT